MFISPLIVILVLVWGIMLYNHFVSLSNKVKEAWSDIDVQLKRRYDLIPNLVNTVKGYATHESSAFEAVTAARAKALGATGAADKAVAEAGLAGALKSVFAIAEAYPELKAQAGFLDLQRQLSDIEDHVQSSRRYYNGSVRDFNTGIQKFPANVLVPLFHFKPFEFFEVEAVGERANPEVKF
jgi:LemA protein